MAADDYVIMHPLNINLIMETSTTVPHRNLILKTIGMVMLLEYMDISVLNTSLPQIAFSLRVNPINLKVALTIYLLAFGAFIPAGSPIASVLSGYYWLRSVVFY